MYLWNYPAGKVSGLCSSQKVTGWEELPRDLTCFSSHLGSISLSATGLLLLKQETLSLQVQAQAALLPVNSCLLTTC